MANIYPNRAVPTAIVQEASLKRSGLISDCILPPVKTPCNFEYIDWTSQQNVKAVETAVTCHSDVRQISSDSFVFVQKKVQDQALEQAMTECCLTNCNNDAAYAARIEASKTVQLMNRLLIGRELQTVKLVTDETQYTATANVPGTAGQSNEGVMFSLARSSLVDPNFALLKWFQPIQTGNALSGMRTKAVMSQNTLNQFLSHPNFIGAGCMVDPMTTKDKVAALLGVREICVGDAYYNNGVGNAVSMAAFWPDNYILFTASYEMLTANEQQVGFGFTAYDKGFRVNYRIDEKKGPDEGVEMQKQAHDLTPVIMTFKAATLVKLT